MGPGGRRIDYPEGEIAISWIGHASDAINLRLMDLETAMTVNEALDIANTMAMPPQNFVAGDAGGNIGWTIAGKIPVRDGFDPRVPADWSAKRAGSAGSPPKNIRAS